MKPLSSVTLQASIRRNPDLVTSNIDGEVVMMSIDQGEYYGLDEVGSRIWELIGNSIVVEELIRILMEEFEVNEDDCKTDTIEFLEELYKKDLLIVS